ncbi:MAG: hypothetical protein AB1390_05755, partial [Nitrospirota bacterium]
SSKRIPLVKKIIYYFFTNPVELSSCPFLEGKNCLIYNQRFFGCRAYGLWSRKYYERFSEVSRRAKILVRNQWENLGVILPKEVMDFQLPYCRHVTVMDGQVVNDGRLLDVSKKISRLSESFGQRDIMFRQLYFSDMSFLLASLVYGFHEAVRLKFTIVRDIVKTGNRTGLYNTVEEIADIF